LPGGLGCARHAGPRQPWQDGRIPRFAGCLSAHDDISRDYFIISVNAVLGDLQARGIITFAERRDLAREWTKNYVRGCLPAFYRKKNAEAVDRLGWFLKAS
jgi:hypothetical protein